MKTKYLLIHSLIFFLCLQKFAAGQDIHFSQFYNSPLTLNPAFTGDYNGDWRAMNTYRSQWSKISPGYVTNAIGYDRQFYVNNEKLSGGINIVYDKSGANSLAVIKANLSAAYHKTINKHSLSIGIQGGYVYKSFDRSKLTFPDQFNNATGQFDHSQPTSDVAVDDKNSFVDFNAGVSWNRKFGSVTPKLGFAIFHLNKPNDAFFDQENKLPWRKVITASFKWELNEDIYIVPQILYMEQVKANDFVLGSTVAKKINDEESKINSIYGGIFARNLTAKTDAVIVTGGLTYRHFDFGLSYDINVSSLDIATDKRGAFEVSLIYTALSTRLVKIKIPCDRY
ncbi:MAG: PorP/SprF family type IX secretion system membrane protein [Bacteroidia bacterium]